MTSPSPASGLPAEPSARRPIEVIDLGRLEYGAALERQQAEVERVRGGGTERLLLVEHPPVYTTGRGGAAENLRGAPQRLGVPLFRVSRGGDVTFHGPGQIVAYPVVSLEHRGRDVHRHLRSLEEVVLRTLAALGVEGRRIAGRTGVWVGGDGPGEARKIAAIGIGVRRWVTYHGLALNVAPDLEYFRAIVPCGIGDAEVTSLARELGDRAPDAAAVRERLVASFLEVFGFEERPRGAAPRRGRAWAGRISAREPGVSAERKPEWLRARAPAGEAFVETRRVLADLRTTTVCAEALCPNLGECWAHSTATFMLMGEVCTRSCGFCAVKHGAPGRLDPGEPARVAEAARRLGLKHVVVTSVNRDDLPDGGAGHFAATARALERAIPDCAVELLIPDFQGSEAALATVVSSPVDVLDHNLETVPRLYPVVRPGARYERSLELVARAKRLRPELLVKCGLMAGLGETDEELVETFADARRAGADILTLGQYLRPTREHLPVKRFVSPAEFAALRERALALGFRHVEAAPLVRSSYHAWEHVRPATAGR